MNILITGGTGLIGKSLVPKLQEHNHSVRLLTRKKSNIPSEYYWSPDEKFIDPNAFENLDVIIHLAGANISQKWSEDYKRELYASRIDTAYLLKEYCVKHQVRLKSFISASGINYYGTFTSDRILYERDGIIQSDFLAKLCEKWEQAADSFSEISNRVVCLRTAMVLARNGGAFPMLKKTVDLNIGAAIGSGKQWMNWIHIDDLVMMYVFAVENNKMEGNFNAVADQIPTNEQFMKLLATISGKIFLPVNVPAFILKMTFGEMSTIILEGSRASNEKIKSLGFDFKFSLPEKTFEDLVKES